MKCDICGSTETKVVNYEHKDCQIKNETITYTSERRVCCNCNNLVYDKELDNNALYKSFRIYNEKIGVSPEEIKKLRKKYRLTQTEFSKIIGCAKKTLISYEQGKSIPNDIYLIVMKTLLDNPEIISLFIKSNKERYEYQEYQNITERLNDYFKKDEVVSNLDGYTDFDSDRTKCLIEELSKNGILKTKLLKMMFYIDFLYYKKNTVGITGLKYKKYTYGPVPENYEKLISLLVDNKVLEYKVTFNNDYEYHEIKSKNKNIDLKKYFEKEEIEVINKVISFFKDFNTSEIVEYSHKEKAFTEPEYNEYISYDYAFDIELN